MVAGGAKEVGKTCKLSAVVAGLDLQENEISVLSLLKGQRKMNSLNISSQNAHFTNAIVRMNEEYLH